MAVAIKITGNKVHDVGYRFFLLKKALELGIERFNAFNTIENGKQAVITYIEGDEDKIEEYKRFAKENYPELASVLQIFFDEYEGHVMEIIEYVHVLQVEQLNKGIPAVLRIDEKLEKLFSIDKKQDKTLEKQNTMIEKQDTMIDKQDKMIEKQDKMLEKQDLMLDKQDKMLEKQDTMIEHTSGIPRIEKEIKGLREDFKTLLVERLDR